MTLPGEAELAALAEAYGVVHVDHPGAPPALPAGHATGVGHHLRWLPAQQFEAVKRRDQQAIALPRDTTEAGVLPHDVLALARASSLQNPENYWMMRRATHVLFVGSLMVVSVAPLRSDERKLYNAWSREAAQYAARARLSQLTWTVSSAIIER